MINKIASLIWEGDPSPEVSPEICLGSILDLTLPSTSCLSRLLAKLVGLAILAGACLNKAPIIFNIFKSKSAAGFSTKSCYSELLVYCNAALYGLLRGNPFTAYGETLIVAAQVFLVCTLVWKYQGVSMKEIGIVSIIFSLYFFAVANLLPSDYYSLILNGNLPILVYSRGLLILDNYKLKHTGNQSLVTHIMNLGGSLVRVLTTLKEIGLDWAMLSGYIISISLNSMLFVQTIIYMKNTKAYFAKLKSKED